MINVRARSQIDCIKMIGGAEQLEEVEVTATSELREERAGEQRKDKNRWSRLGVRLFLFFSLFLSV